MRNLNRDMLKAALFDLDGVIFDTEPQYSIFWGAMCRKYHPEQPGLENRIKGQTLVQIFEGHFKDMPDAQKDILAGLDEYEGHMSYDYVEGFVPFITALRQHGILTALVTSSNIPKMQSVYRAHPELDSFFDAILTSEHFRESKPAPDCYLQAAGTLGVSTNECVVFEDSFNGLRSGRAAGMVVVGLSTTNAAETIAPLCDHVIPCFTSFDFDQCANLL